MVDAPASVTEGLDANVHIKLSKLDELRSGVARANDKIAQLEAALVAEKQADKTGELTKLREMMRECFTIVRFAVANLPPETTKKWPTLALLAIIERLPSMPDYTVDDQAFTNELRQFRREIFEIDLQRVMRDEDKKKRLAESSKGLNDPPIAGHIDMTYAEAPPLVVVDESPPLVVDE